MGYDRIQIPGRRGGQHQSRQTTPLNRTTASEQLQRAVRQPGQSSASTILQLQHLYGNQTVTTLLQRRPSGVIQRAGGLPTDQELITQAGGHGAGKKLFGKSSFKKILDALKAFRDNVGDNDTNGKLQKLAEIMKQIWAWRASSERTTVKTGDVEKRAALADLETKVRAQLLLLASDPQVVGDPTQLANVQARIQPLLANTPHLNDASNQEENLRVDKFRNQRSAFRIPAQINCALCSCAAVIRHVTGLAVTTGDLIVRLHAQTNPASLHNEFGGKLPPDYFKTFQHPGSLAALGYRAVGPSDIDNINATNVDKIQECCQLFGVKPGPVGRNLPLDQAMVQMEGLLPQGYVFAVLIAGEGHWNFARAGTGGKLEFVDYQSDHAEFGGLAAGATPQVGIISKVIPAKDQKTDFVAFKG